MAKLTNISGTYRALPLINKTMVEFKPGETKDFPDADFAAISARTSVQHSFKVEDAVAPTPAAAVPIAPIQVAINPAGEPFVVGAVEVPAGNLPSADPKPVVKVKKAAAQ